MARPQGADSLNTQERGTCYSYSPTFPPYLLGRAPRFVCFPWPPTGEISPRVVGSGRLLLGVPPTDASETRLICLLFEDAKRQQDCARGLTSSHTVEGPVLRDRPDGTEIRPVC